MKTSHFFVSVIAILDNDADVLASLIEDLTSVMENNYENYELVFIDNGSTDKTNEKIEPLLRKFKCIRYLRLATKVDYQIAIYAGMETVIGDVIVVFSSYYDPFGLIKDGIEQAYAEGKAVFGQYEKRANRSFLGVFFGGVFYWYVNKVLGFKTPKHTTDFRVLHRKELNALLQVKDASRHLMLLNTYTGFGWTALKYNEIERKKKKRKTFRELVKIAKNIIVTNSVHPLKLLSKVVVLLGLILLAITIFNFPLLKDSNWFYVLTSVMLVVFGLYLYILSEYVCLIIKESLQPIKYVVVEEKNSAVLISQAERRNVFNASL